MKNELESFLADERGKFDKELDRLVPPETEYPEPLYRAMRHSLFAGGKRIRPILALAAAEAFDFTPEIIYPAGAAIEMIHTYSLIHDDLPALDNDDIRRGKPTCHKVFGEAMAILAGDTLNALAFGILASLPLPPERIHLALQVIRELSDYSGIKGMARGQVADILSEGKRVAPETLEFIHWNKTAALIVCAIRTGCILSEADDKSLKEMTDLGGHIGLAFQIKDDILDITSSTGELGKTAGKDSATGKATYPSVFGMEKAETELKRLSAEAIRIAGRFAKRAPWLYYIVEYLLQRRN
jgi:geranylgeranyl diphosphate synthase type II